MVVPLSKYVFLFIILLVVLIVLQLNRTNHFTFRTPFLPPPRHRQASLGTLDTLSFPFLSFSASTNGLTATCRLTVEICPLNRLLDLDFCLSQ